MKSKISLVVIIIFVVAFGATVFTGQMQSAKQTVVSATTNSSGITQIPTSVLYDRMFRLIISFRAKAEIQKLKGERVTLMKTYFKDEAKLSDEDNEILENTATEFIKEVRTIDDEAGEIIAQGRDLFPDGEVPNGQQVPPPPKELANLQKKRNDLALKYRDELSQLLGSKAFSNIDDFVHGNFAANFQSIPLSAVPQN